MIKRSLARRVLKLSPGRCVLYVVYLIVHIQFFTCCRTRNYYYIPRDAVPNELFQEIHPKLILKKSKPDCKYDIIQSTTSINSWQIPMKFDAFVPLGLANGSYIPEECNPKFSVAILITYRNRQKQLAVLLPYLHDFLRKQGIHYKIYVIEQQDEKAWNKGVLYNIGAKYAIADKFPCLILHDVDLLPLDLSNLYVCTKEPRHMSASIDKYRFLLPYKTLVGGVLAVTAVQYTSLNGFSNRFRGWGGEDDDFSERILANNMHILRFPRDMSRYSMMMHHPEAQNGERFYIIEENKQLAERDGLNSVQYKSLQVKHHRLFTLIGVKL